MTKKRKSAPSTVISNCTFTGVKWDPVALETVQTVARALETLTLLFRSQGITGPLMQIGVPAKIGIDEQPIPRTTLSKSRA